MKLLGLLAGLALATVPVLAEAHGPTRQKVTVTVEIDAPPAKVWERVGKFDDMSWHPAVAKTTGQGGNAIDATRRLNLGAEDGPIIDEVLYKFSDEKRSYSYRITAVEVEVLPVTNYSSHLTVKDGANGGSLVEWRGAFYRGDPNNGPPPELNDEAAVKAVKGVYRTGLDALKAEMEAGN
ncbi:MAG: SRPBCC family protein [Pseudomonadota bacterium]